MKTRFLCPLLVLLSWQLAAASGLLPPELTSSPLEILQGIWELERVGLPPDFYLHNHILFSLRLVSTGFFLALACAVPLGILLGASRMARALLSPLFEFLRPVPPLAWIPISMLWFGIGFPSACFIIFLGAFFPILVNTTAGVADVPKGLIGAAEILGADRVSLWRKVLLPASLPNILTGIRLGMGIAWMTLVAAEFTGVQEGYGLGYMIMTARDLQRLDLILAGMAVIGLIGIAIERILCYLSRLLLRGR